MNKKGMSVYKVKCFPTISYICTITTDSWALQNQRALKYTCYCITVKFKSTFKCSDYELYPCLVCLAFLIHAYLLEIVSEADFALTMWVSECTNVHNESYASKTCRLETWRWRKFQEHVLFERRHIPCFFP